MTADGSAVQRTNAVKRELLLALYCDHLRMDAACAAQANAPPGAWFDTMLDFGRGGDAQARQALRRNFFRAQLEGDSNWAEEDAEPLIDGLLTETRGLAKWLEQLRALFAPDVAFERDRPRVALASLSAWHLLTRRLDGDAIIAFLLATRGWAFETEELTRWGLVTSVSERDLDAVMERGVSDLHVHLGGARSARLSWLALINGELDFRALRAYARPPQRMRTRASVSVIGGVSPSADQLARRREADLIARVAEALRPDAAPSALNGPFAPIVRLLRAERERLTPNRIADMAQKRRERLGVSELERRMLAERSMMAIAFDKLRRSDRASPRGARLEHALDAYIVAKSWFLARHTQGVETNPGLQHFRGYFSGMKPLRAPGAVERISLRVAARREHAPSLFAMEPGHPLKRLELRLGPLDSPSDYVRFLTLWERLERDLGLAATQDAPALVDIRFAIHFKRSLGGFPQRPIPPGMTDPAPPAGVRRDTKRPPSHAKDPPFLGSALASFLSGLDRDTAMLHMFRTMAPQRLRPLAARIAPHRFRRTGARYPRRSRRILHQSAAQRPARAEDVEGDGPGRPRAWARFASLLATSTPNGARPPLPLGAEARTDMPCGRRFLPPDRRPLWRRRRAGGAEARRGRHDRAWACGGGGPHALSLGARAARARPPRRLV